MPDLVLRPVDHELVLLFGGGPIGELGAMLDMAMLDSLVEISEGGPPYGQKRMSRMGALVAVGGGRRTRRRG
ncbi:MAG: hypothetical protein A2W28_09715 [Gammaproteobacteria bacterium RBG_16_51_14]|nr:MAG: hypothetical protein A2W28_09715 [Gammaproteobacteria bacterium RBG_16_51_14]